MPPTPGHLADQDRGPPLLAYFVVIACVTILAIIGRFCSRLQNRQLKGSRSRLWWDDWAALAAVPLILGTLVCGITMIHYGLGRHIWNVPAPDRIPLLKAFFAAQIIYPTAIGLCRMSALLFCSRIFRTRTSPGWFRYGIYVTQGFNAAWIIAVTVDKFFICQPFAKSWNSKLPGKCGDVSPYWLGSAISSVVIDIIVLVLPLPVIWALNLSKGRKAALSAVFVCGYCVVIISVGRVIVIMRQQSAMAADLTYASPPAMYWLFGESPMALLSICLPAMSSLGNRCIARLKPLTSMIRSLLSSRSSTTSEPEMAEADQRATTTVGDDIYHKESMARVAGATSANRYQVDASHSHDEIGSDISRRSSSNTEVDRENIHVKTTFSVWRQPE